MSRYMINKLMWQIDRDHEALEAFKRDPTGFIATWESPPEPPTPPYPDGGALTTDERDAFLRGDYARLYALGAHPYLLWHFVRAVASTEGTNVGELSDSFKDGIRSHGVPDFTT